tara:strand:- start:51 stop:800 length:750 start_codon:yes stop_codon:yes gene_type:complete
VNIIPAIDLKDNKCVRLSKGKDETSEIFNENPKEQALYFEKIGCKKLHIIDLDAAFGRPYINLASIEDIVNATNIPIQVGGGIRDIKIANQYFNIGVQDLIIGSMAVNSPATVIELSNSYKKRIYISLDILNNNIMVKGWKEQSPLSVDDMLTLYSSKNIKGFIVTDIDNDGMLNGLNIEFISKITDKIQSSDQKDKTIIIAGGLTNYDDLRNIKSMKLSNIEGIISGKSFYTGNIDLTKAQKILSTDD